MESQAMSPSNSSAPKPEKLKGPATSSSNSSAPKREKLKGPATSSSSSSTPTPKKLKGLALCSSSSSTPKSEKLKAPIVAMEKAKGKATMNTGLKLGSPPEVMSERMIENPSFGSSAVRTRGDILKLYPPKSNKIFTCPFCKKEFSSSQALGGHQNAHKQEREWEKKRKEMEANFPALWFLNRYTDNPHILLGGYSNGSLSNENYLGITLDPFKRLIYPSFNNGVIRGSTGMGMTEVPRASPSSFFTGNTSTNYGSSSSRIPIPLPNNISPLSFVERNVFPFPPPTTKLSGNMVSQENVLSEENFISKIGENNVVVIDDDEDDMQPKEGKSKTGGIDLSLSL